MRTGKVKPIKIHMMQAVTGMLHVCRVVHRTRYVVNATHMLFGNYHDIHQERHIKMIENH